MKLSAEDEAFLNEIALLMVPWGWPRPVGRIYAYLLLRAGPATLDEIAADLGMSKSNASVAARTLERCGTAQRHSEPGSKRIYYAAPDTHGTSFIERAALLGRLGSLFGRQAMRPLPGAVTDRFDTLTAFYTRMREAMEEVIEAEPVESVRRAAAGGG